MVIKTIFFSEEYLAKHLSFDRELIVTGRFGKKGRPGDIFRINDENDLGYWVLTSVSKRPMKVLAYAMKYWRLEGFSSWQELFEALSNLYGPSSEIYAHYFQKTSLDEGDF